MPALSVYPRDEVETVSVEAEFQRCFWGGGPNLENATIRRMSAGGATRPRPTRLRLLIQTLRRWRLVKESRPFLLLLAFLIGVAAGGLALGFGRVAEWGKGVAEGAAAGLNPQAGHFLPVIAGLIVMVVLMQTPRIGGRGFSGIIHAVFRDHGHLSLNNGLKKLALSAVSIAGHGSVGRESMIAHVSAATGSWLGRLFHLPPRKVTRLVAAAAAAAIAATYGAPLAGILFATELLVEEVHLTLGPMIMAALGARLVVSIAGREPSFAFPHWEGLGDSPLDGLPWYLAVGAAAGLVAALYAWVLEKMAHRRPGGAAGPLVAGIALALASASMPSLLGGGYEAAASWVSGGGPGPTEAAVYIGGKVLLTALCVAVGWAGGHFGPCLSIGLALGFVFQHFQGDPSTALPVAAAASLVAALTHAPIALVVMVYELTGATGAFLPVGAAAVMAVLAYDALHLRSIYDSPLLAPAQAPIPATVPHADLPVDHAMETEVATLPHDGTLEDLLAALRTGGQRAFPVMEGGRLTGLITRTDLRHALHPKGASPLPTETLSQPLTRWMVAYDDLLLAHPDEPILDAVGRMSLTGHGIGQLPVVSREDPRHLLGLLTREGLLAGLSGREPDDPPP